ncbi:DUF2079 domain-containing protein [Streptomyces sp. NPDC005568]|uniref:DUF2079 domain-containing protein n=1 Tax=Streptomyces sp. NPDC005568 TaxID=3156887 RepID=UPI0033B825BD
MQSLNDRSPRPPSRTGFPDLSQARGPLPGVRLKVSDRQRSWLLAGLLFTLYTALSVRTHHRMLTTGYDLGIFEQAVRSYAHGHLPVSEVKGSGFPLLGDHFSPVLALIAPVYRLWPTAETLLVVQSALLSVAVVPLMRRASANPS